jgi:ABC-type transport system involved in multi-copper enzyme maturation permease subunit
MIALTKSELLKLRTTRTAFGLLLGMSALTILVSVLTGLLSHAGTLSGTENERQLLGLGNLAGIFSALAGILLVTSEYRYGTIRPTFLFTPRRPRVLAAKLAASALAGLLFGTVGEGLAFAIGYAILSGRGIALSLGGGDIAQLLLGTLASAAFFGVLGAELGTIIRNQVGAVITLLAWGLFIDTLVFSLVPSVGRFSPGNASDALIGVTEKNLLAPVTGAMVLIAWLAALALIALPLINRRDVL